MMHISPNFNLGMYMFFIAMMMNVGVLLVALKGILSSLGK